MKSEYEGLQGDIRKLETPEIETWTNQYSDIDYEIEITIPEFTSLCPRTGLPDFGTIKIKYAPDKKCVELKSLKLYILFYRDVGIFYEHAVNKILEDFVKACQPRRVEVVGDFNIRGGIQTTVRVEWQKGKEVKR